MAEASYKLWKLGNELSPLKYE